MPETRANNYNKKTSYVPKNNKRVQQKNSARYFTSSLVNINEQTLLETPFINNKKQKITTETMDISFPKVINEVIENIILSTDNNNQTLSNTRNDNTTNTFNIEIDNIVFSTFNSTEKI
ncbi:7378_t:CDS:1 [Funneliformis mosseae]|uniref:7378_t:CDS:1 n=1 Tax=Funneliformis mosseae TaxID=27381 RepID=A0A9N9DQ20_FUNMO|nr:7378_t:CDS:1 [Funneliformis mosseae]